MPSHSAKQRFSPCTRHYGRKELLDLFAAVSHGSVVVGKFGPERASQHVSRFPTGCRRGSSLPWDCRRWRSHKRSDRTEDNTGRQKEGNTGAAQRIGPAWHAEAASTLGSLDMSLATDHSVAALTASLTHRNARVRDLGSLFGSNMPGPLPSASGSQRPVVPADLRGCRRGDR